ncbi:Uncharacterized protein OBRU01_25144, partial [Operophtera brumata]
MNVNLGQTPKFHYETRKFSMVQCNTDLNENDLELTIARGIAYNVPNPKEIDTYVKFDWCSGALCCSGWFRGDTLLGAASVKLAPLETNVTIHDAFP